MAFEFSLESITNRQTWVERIEMVDEDGAAFPGLAGATGGKVEVRSRDGNETILTGTPTFTSTYLEWTFSETDVRNLEAGAVYDVGVQFTISGVTYNPVGEIEVEDGVIA